MTAYTSDRRPQMGWGEAVPQFFNSNVTVKNWALGGRSSRSFYYETTRWPAILPQINSGDYVIIQFAHNDQKYGSDYAGYGTYAFCSDGSGNGETCTGATDAVDSTVDKSEHSYYQFLKRYVTEVRAKGAYPILMSPIVRKYFSGSTITSTGQHNLTAVLGTETAVRGDYVAAMKAVATAYSVPFVDITAETKAIVESYGDAAATANLYIAADSTHPQVLFANLIAKRAVEGMKTLNILKDYMIPVTSLIASPSTLDWSTRYVTVPSTKSVTLSAFDLSPAASSVTVTAPSSEFLLSLDNTTWSSSVSIPYTNSAFTSTLYVKFTPAAVQSYSGVLTFSLGGVAMSTSVAVSGTGISAGAGVDSYASWFTAGTALTAVTDGLVTASDVTVSGLSATTSKVLAVDGQDTTVARYTVTSVSRVATEYLQFAVAPASGTFNVDTISAYLASSGGSTVQADMEYSTDLSTWTKLNADAALAFVPKETMFKESYSVAIVVPTGSTLYLRIYPWNTAGTAGKQIALYNVKVSGKASQ
ncbi:MAG: hypothetical protein H6R19_1420 [Proteobacteria bacterium]|nr:hypothetical protein [Pseudomonadota bacterium]